MSVSSSWKSSLVVVRRAARAFAPRLLLGLSMVPAGLRAQATCPDPAAIRGDLDAPLWDIRFLADDALGGREVGTAGAACAADYIAMRFAEIGLRAPSRSGGYFQEFSVTTGAELGAGNRFEVAGRSYTLGEDWIPFGFSGSSEVEGSLLYGGLGMPGQILVTEAADPHTPEAESMERNPHFLAATAARHGTAALVVLLPDGAPLPDPAAESRPRVPIPVIAVAGESREGLRARASEMAEARLVTSVSPGSREARNVVALLPGSDAAASDETVVVGAHFDHLGLGGEGSLAPDARGQVHNGADDNASGTAALLEVARRLARSPPARSVLFVAFSGEERGLWGSAHYVREPVRPLRSTVAMLNMDMVGRLGEGPLTVFGVGTAEEWEHTLTAANEELDHPLGLSLLPDGFGPSDHSSFYGEGIPVLHFFTNAHEDYHRPSDDWEKIDEAGLLAVSALVAEVTRRVAGARPGQALALTPVEGAGNPHGGRVDPDEAQSVSGYGPYLGTIPDMTPRETGVRLTGVRDGSPAQVAGIQAGDVVVEFDGAEITDLYAYTYALREHEPGDRVRIVVLRDGERVTVTAVLGQRR